jgi:hypothetical protein
VVSEGISAVDLIMLRKQDHLVEVRLAKLQSPDKRLCKRYELMMEPGNQSLQHVTAAGPWDDESLQRRMHACPQFKPYFRMQRYLHGKAEDGGATITRDY